MTVFLREFRKNCVGLLIWGVCIVGLAYLMVSQYQTSAEALGTASYPEAFVKALGMDRVNMATPLGYYAGKASVLVTLFGGIYAALLGGGAIVRDESLLSRPVSRVSIALQRLLSVAANVLLLDLAVACVLFSCGGDSTVWWITLGQFLLHMTFAAAGMLVASARIRQRASLALPLGIVLAAYVLSMLNGMAEGLDFLKYLTPFYYADVRDIVINKAMPALHVAVVSAIIMALAALGTAIYHRRDLPV